MEGGGTDFVGAFELADEDARVGGCDAECSGDEGLEEGRRGGGVVHCGGFGWVGLGWWGRWVRLRVCGLGLFVCLWCGDGDGDGVGFFWGGVLL